MRSFPDSILTVQARIISNQINLESNEEDCSGENIFPEGHCGLVGYSSVLFESFSVTDVGTLCDVLELGT